MGFGEAIYYLLANDATVSGIVGTKIFALRADQETSLPFITYARISNNPTDTKTGTSTVDTIHFQVSCFDDDYSDCRTLAEAVRAELDRYSGNPNSHMEIQTMGFDGEVELFEDNPATYHIAMDFYLRHVR